MFDWIFHNRDVFTSNYVSIGHSFQEAKVLQEEHGRFTAGSNVGGLFILTYFLSA